MPTLTRNLFRGQGERTHSLDVVEGHWPDDVEGSVYVVGPDKREPGGHWFAEPGLIERIRLRPDPDGRVRVEHRCVDTPVARIRRRVPWLFHRLQFMELSPFGVSNLANTGVQALGDRLFVGYDAGRPVEIDPESLEHLTPVGANDEWLQGAPGTFEPLCAVAAHPAADLEASTLYFVNYAQVSAPGVPGETHLARWRGEGPVDRWRVEGMSDFDSIHDVKVTEHHVVFADLPFVIEPGMWRGDPRTRRIQEHTSVWIVAKRDLDAVAPGGAVRATEVRLPMPTGHLLVDHEEPDGQLRLVAQHMPLADLMITMDRTIADHRSGEPIDVDYEGLVAICQQPSVIGRYLIDPASGAVLESDRATDVDRCWGGVLTTSDTTRQGARTHQRQLFYAAIGFDPDLVPEPWWDLYHDAADAVVAPVELPEHPVAGSLSRVDLEAMKVADVWTYEDGAFPSPPTFVPRVGSDEPDDGYVAVVVHRDGPKELQLFDAGDLGSGPVARATAPDFNPALLLHSCWMPDRVGPRSSSYRVSRRRDVLGALRGIPGVLARLVRVGRSMRTGAAAPG